MIILQRVVITIKGQRNKAEQTKPEVSRLKRITKIRAERNETETKKTIKKINEIKSWSLKR